MSKIVGILQARVSSSRLPGKVLEPILGAPMLARQLERLGRARRIDHLLVATSIQRSDDALDALCQSLGIACFRGSLEDVLDRFYQAARPHAPAHVVRLTGDCPLADPALIDRVIDIHLQQGSDYTCNTLVPSYPDGLDVEVMRFGCLVEAWREAKLPSHREHVTPFLHQQPERFLIAGVQGDVDLSMLRWTVDEPADLELVTRVYEALYPGNPAFSTGDVLALLERDRDLREMNTMHERNEGYRRSLLADARRQTAED